ncbi:XdhC family protein [Sphingobacterium sp. SRCM116780]|uniref:XdhC family protein n=1 Tax=Sphingobacterium sp. SRCM116780 TaxID=2907623 RepID=UPI001F180217|nr:XdhC/CoxI family protein [Sphingobacterium sp. SRCM116780]UIR56849.1 XdhC family protein [Sphingobacterium sp. SRCM116780]
MNELCAIIEAYQEAEQANIKAVLATVVKVEGSSYRMPGARMLVTEFGEMTGAISGGCLEGDALRRAMLALTQQTNKLVTYDTSNDADVTIGVQLGCNGIVHILFEYIDHAKPNNPITLLEKLLDKRTASVVVTVCSLDRNADQPGTCCVQLENETLFSDTTILSLTDLSASIEQVFASQQTLRTVFAHGQSTYEVLFEYVIPVTRLILIGAGNDVQPLVEMANIMGWESWIVDGRSTHATKKRFPTAKSITVTSSDEFQQQITIDPYSVCVLMSHNYNYDKAILQQLITTDCPYIGLLGPKKRFMRMVEELQAEGITLDSAQQAKLFGPVGLDIGAETSAEIALAILAEIKAVLHHKSACSLRDRTGKMHQDISII